MSCVAVDSTADSKPASVDDGSRMADTRAEQVMDSEHTRVPGVIHNSVADAVSDAVK